MTDLQKPEPKGVPTSLDTSANPTVIGGPSREDTPPTLSPGAASDGSTATPSYLDGLSPDNLQIFENKGWKDMNDALSSYNALSKKLGSSLNVPDETATDEDWQKFYARLGRPSEVNGYEFSLPDGLPEDFPYDNEAASQFKDWAHKAGLNSRQADHLHGQYVQMQAAQLKQMSETFSRDEQQAHDQLSQAWGGEKSEKFQQNVGFAMAALNGAGDEVTHALQDAGLLSDDGDLRNAAIGIWLAKLGSQYYADDSFAAGNSAGLSTNPFVRDENGKTNLTDEAIMMKNDPHRAVSLIRAAGREKDFASFLK